MLYLVDARQKLRLHRQHKNWPNKDLLTALSTGTNVGMLTDVQDVDEHVRERLHDYENYGSFLRCR